MARAKTMELDAALPSWVAAEQSLEVIAGSSTELDAEYMTVAYLAAALAKDYLAAERKLRVSTEVATPPGVTIQQQQHAPGVETLGDDGEPPESSRGTYLFVDPYEAQRAYPLHKQPWGGGSAAGR